MLHAPSGHSPCTDSSSCRKDPAEVPVTYLGMIMRKSSTGFSPQVACKDRGFDPHRHKIPDATRARMRSLGARMDRLCLRRLPSAPRCARRLRVAEFVSLVGKRSSDEAPGQYHEGAYRGPYSAVLYPISSCVTPLLSRAPDWFPFVSPADCGFTCIERWSPETAF